MEIEFSGWEIELESTGLAGGIEVQGGLDLDFGTMASEAANPGDNGLALDLNLGDLGSNTQNQSGAGAVQLPDEPLPIEQKPQEGAYEGNEETLLTSRKYKYDMVGSLNEMLFFFQERLQSQKNHSSNSVLQAYDSSFVGELFQISEKELEKYIGELRRILGCFSEQNLTLILSLLENPKNIEQIKGRLSSFEGTGRRIRGNIRNLERRLAESEETIKESRTKTNSLKQASLKLKNRLQEEFKASIKKTTVINLVQAQRINK